MRWKGVEKLPRYTFGKENVYGLYSKARYRKICWCYFQNLLNLMSCVTSIGWT